MSDVPPRRFSVPELPTEIMLKIFLLCDAKTLVRVQCTSHYWMETLASYEFVNELDDIWRNQGFSIFGHFGYSDNSRRTLDWIIKFNSNSGQRFPAVLPFDLGSRGWFDIIGIQKGVFCFRFSRTGEFSTLLIWNPMTQHQFWVADPIQLIADDSSFLFSFLYFPGTLNYSIVSIFLELGEENRCVFTTYDSMLRDWTPRVQCPDYVRKLDPAYVALNDASYWVTWSHDEPINTAPYIISFSSLTTTFQQISLLEEAHTTCHSLLIRDDHLCLGANTHNAQGYNTVIWQVDFVGDQLSWSKLFNITGSGHAFIPVVMIDGDIIQVLERHVQVEDVEDMEYTHFHLRRFFAATGRKKSLLWVNYEDGVKLRSIHPYYEGFYP
ncbi:hypothetical protein PIB30_039402, partial [Stylosanthes scabra]|nr:hypothetical protein [Stylosanthes scabra]